MKPIKIKKKDKRCSYCNHYNQYRCSKYPKVEIPIKVYNKGCNKYKKNKYLYF